MPWQAATCLQRWIAGEPDVKQERHSTDEKYLMEIIYDDDDRKQANLMGTYFTKAFRKKTIYRDMCTTILVNQLKSLP